MLHQLLDGFIAQTAGGGSSGAGASFWSFGPFVLIFVVMYFLILRPQSQQAKKTQTFLASLKKGDEVLLQNAIYGRIFEVRETDVTVELAPNVKIRVLKTGISGPATPAGGSKAAEQKGEAEKKS